MSGTARRGRRGVAALQGGTVHERGGGGAPLRGEACVAPPRFVAGTS